jgi:hypothetical protein
MSSREIYGRTERAGVSSSETTVLVNAVRIFEQLLRQPLNIGGFR